MNFNTLTQNEQQLKNFDLSEYRQVIFSTIIVSHQQIIQQIQEIIRVHIVPAILDHDEMARGKQKGKNFSFESGFFLPKIFTFSNKCKNSIFVCNFVEMFFFCCIFLNFFYDFFFSTGKRVSGVFYEPRSLVNQLDHFYELFKIFGLDDIFIDQIFHQFFYYICAISLNNLMLRRELCMWKTGMRIRYNISCLEEWARKMKMVCSSKFFLLSSLLQSKSSFETNRLDIFTEQWNHRTINATYPSRFVVASKKRNRSRCPSDFRHMLNIVNCSSNQGTVKIFYKNRNTKNQCKKTVIKTIKKFKFFLSDSEIIHVGRLWGSNQTGIHWKANDQTERKTNQGDLVFNFSSLLPVAPFLIKKMLFFRLLLSCELIFFFAFIDDIETNSVCYDIFAKISLSQFHLVIRRTSIKRSIKRWKLELKRNFNRWCGLSI